MKKLLFSLLTLGAGACQPQATDHATATSPAPAAPATPLAALPPTASAASAPAAEAAPVAPTLPAADAALLRRYDLAPLWAGDQSESSRPVMDGFFGDRHERIGFFFSSVRRDPQRPGLYHVQGKNRFHKLVTAFTGTIQATACRLLDSRQLAADGSILDLEAHSKLYSVAADFDFQEDPRTSAAGRFRGKAHLDFVPDAASKPQIIITMNERLATPSEGAGVLYRGQWVSYTSHAAKPLLLGNNVFVIAPADLTNFGLGSRDLAFNPKYAKLGWNDYWANDEWWVDAPGSSATL